MKLARYALLAALPLAASFATASAQAARTPAEEANVKAVTAFYNAALNDKDIDKAKTYLGPTYKQHNPQAKDGVEGFVGFITFIKTQFPNNKSEIKQSFVDGDTVILHVLSKRTPEQAGSAVIDIFRLSKGKIVEHWDAIQPIPEKSENTNTMF